MPTLALLGLLSTAAPAVDIANPGFEQGAAGWTIETGRAGSDTGGPNRVEFVSEGAFEGSTCAKLSYQSSWLWLTTSSLPASVSGKRLKVAMRAKWLSGAGLLSLGFTEFERGTRKWAGAHDGLVVVEVPEDRRWHLLEVALDVPAIDTQARDIGIKLGCSHGVPSEMLVDAVAIPDVGPRPAPTALPLMIDNPGCEDGGAGWRWELGAGSTLTWPHDDPHSGKQCAELSFPGQGWAWLETLLPDLKPGSAFRVSFWAKRLGEGGQLSVGFSEVKRLGLDWVGAHDGLWTGEVPRDEQWHRVSAPIVTPAFDADADMLMLKIGIAGSHPASRFRLDDIIIEGQPEAEIRAPAFLERPDIPIRSSRLGAGAAVGPVRLSAPPRIEPKLGQLTRLPVTVRNRSDRAVTMSLRPHCPVGVAVSECTLTLEARATREVALELRTLQPLPHEVILEAAVGGDRAGLSVPVEPRRAFPVFGVVEHFDRNPPGRDRASRDAAMLHQMPCAAYRIDCGWAAVDPGGGKPYQFDSTDWYVNLVRQTGHAPVLMMLGYFPNWAAPFDDPTDEVRMGEHRRAIRAIVQRYADQVDYWETWNEPFGFWFGGDSQAYLEKGPAMLLAVQKTVWEAVREFDPTARVLTPGLLPMYSKGQVEWRMLDRLFGMGYDQYIDAVCVHNYPGHEPPPLTPYRIDGEQRLAVDSWRRLDRAADMQDLLDLMDSHHIRKPVWLTEFGGFDPQDERAQALACLHTVGVIVPQRVQGALYYELYDYPHDSHPPTLNLLRSRDLHRTLGFVAYQDMIAALTGATCDPAAAAVETPEGTECRCFTRPRETIVLLWSNRADTTTTRIRWRAPVRRVTCTSWDPAREAMREVSQTDDPEGGRTATLHPLEFLVTVAQSAP